MTGWWEIPLAVLVWALWPWPGGTSQPLTPPKPKTPAGVSFFDRRDARNVALIIGGGILLMVGCLIASQYR
jgi:hypothetical protein